MKARVAAGLKGSWRGARRFLVNSSHSASKFLSLLLFGFLGALLLWVALASPASSHWADLAVAEVIISEKKVEVTLTFPTGLAAFADGNGDGQLSAEEVHSHEAELQRFLGDRVRLANGKGLGGTLAVKPLETVAIAEGRPSAIAPALPAATHSALLLDYTWPEPTGGLQIYYDLFLPGVPTASCQATILHEGQVVSFTFTPTNKQFSFGRGSYSSWSWLLAIAGAFLWGAMHALSPGHGKTIVSAYLLGSRATPQHALFLALATTVTHTAAVFAVGGATFFASHWFSPERLHPWLSFVSGLVVTAIGVNLAIGRLPEARSQLRRIATRSQPVDLLSRGTWEREFSPVGASHDGSHGHHHHEGGSGHRHHGHSHLPPGADGSPITWQSLLGLGISGGLLPCPSALVMLLSAVSLGSIGLGLALTVAFSLGLAGVLTGMGLAIVYARRFFEQLPISRQSARGRGFVKVLPAVSAILVVVLGLTIAGQALAMILQKF